MCFSIAGGACIYHSFQKCFHYLVDCNSQNFLFFSDCNNSSSNNVGGATAAGVVGAAATVAPAIEVSVPVQVEREISQERERNNRSRHFLQEFLSISSVLSKCLDLLNQAKRHLTRWPSLWRGYHWKELKRIVSYLISFNLVRFNSHTWLRGANITNFNSDNTWETTAPDHETGDL